MAESVQIATLKWALQYAGSAFELGRHIGVSEKSINGFLNGSEEMPGWLFLRAVDYVNEEQERPHQQPTVVFLDDRRKASRSS